MSLANTTLWGNILPGGPPDISGGIDSTQVIDELLPSLHAESRADLVWWTEGDLIQWMDEGLKRLARLACVFIGRAEQFTVAATATYPVPPQHISTLHVSFGSTPLRASNMAELEARDPQFRTVAGTPTNWYQDQLGASTIGLSPVPTDATVIPIIYEGWPATLDAGRLQTIVPAPPPLKAYLGMWVLAEAYGRESDLEAPDIAAHCRERAGMIEQMLIGYYGRGI